MTAKKYLLISFGFLLCYHVNAQLRLPSILSSGMVLQQNDSVLLWGWADPLEKIAITTGWNNLTETAITQNNAKWELKVKTPPAGGPYTIAFKGNSIIELKNILIGEVWVCSGQSNMQWNFWAGVYDMQPEINLNTQNNIRFFSLPKSTSDYPQEDVNAEWIVCDSNTLKSFSAVGYFFGKELQKNLNIPIGLINTSWGATPAEVWTPADKINSNTILQNAAQKQLPKPWCPVEPGVVYNSMIFPLTKYPIAGVIWYQGESNTAAPASYSKLLSTMIDSWRNDWMKQFPFYLVQIAPYTYGNNYSAALIREQQAITAKNADTKMVVITDLVDDTTNIHPKNKKEVGRRLAHYTLSATYKVIEPVLSPVYESMKVVKGKAILSFINAESGIEMRGKLPEALLIAGEDKIFYPAIASINKENKLVVWSNKVKTPIAVRFGFCNACIGNLFAKNGMPVAPFRTDDWSVE